MMKKLSLILAVLLLAIPAMADVTIDGTDNSDLTADVTYSADADVSAFALTINVSAGSIVGFTPAMTGECTATEKGYGIFPGSIDINDTTNQIDGVGTPVVAVDADTIIIEMGALYVDANKPAQSGTLGTLEVTEGCTVTITAEPIRGGIVYAGTNPTSATLDDGVFTIAPVSAGACALDLNNDTYLGPEDVGAFVTLLSGYSADYYYIASTDSNYDAGLDLNNDTYLGPEDVGALVTILSGYSADYYYVLCADVEL